MSDMGKVFLKVGEFSHYSPIQLFSYSVIQSLDECIFAEFFRVLIYIFLIIYLFYISYRVFLNYNHEYELNTPLKIAI